MSPSRSELVGVDSTFIVVTGVGPGFRNRPNPGLMVGAFHEAPEKERKRGSIRLLV